VHEFLKLDFPGSKSFLGDADIDAVYIVTNHGLACGKSPFKEAVLPPLVWRIKTPRKEYSPRNVLIT
jgi:hypothetical protein